MFEAIYVGFGLGILHVLAGADHLIAMTPASFASPKEALKNGFSWGIGHSLGVIILTFLAIFIQDNSLKIEQFSSFAEFFVGFSLLVIGVLAIKNSFGLNIHSHVHQHNNGLAHHHLHIHGNKKINHSRHSHALTTLGILHGVAGGAHLFAPLGAFALASNRSDFNYVNSFVYLLCYLIGSLFIMTLFTVLISFFTINFGHKLIKRFVAFVGGVSFTFGLFLMQQSASLIIG